MSQVATNLPQPRFAAGWGRKLYRWGILLILFDVLIGSTILGFQLRRWFWDFSQPARFRGDVQRNYDFGRAALEQGYWNVYQNQILTNPPPEKKINYPPLRLAVFEAWAAVNQWRYGLSAAEWREDHSFNAFMMYYNSVLEWLGAIGAYLLVRHWVIRSSRPPDMGQAHWMDRLPSGAVRATLAFLILWFNPAMIVSAHGWPSTDMWVIPFFIWAVLFASWEKWFIAGLVMGIGAMFKGQQLFVVGMFLLWPIFAGQPGRAMRFLIGFAFAVAIVLSGWMLSSATDLDPATTARQINWLAVGWVVALPLVIWLLMWNFPHRTRLYGAALGMAVAMFLCIPMFHANTDWYTLGFKYGTERHNNLVVGPGNNLCAILEQRFGWQTPNDIVFTIPAKSILHWPAADYALELRVLLFAVYVLFMVISCIAVARQWRANDRKFLVAIVVPYLLLYTLCAQMHERYLLYGSGVAAVVIACSFGLELLNIFLIFLTALQTMNCMQMANPQLTQSMDHQLFNAQLFTLGSIVRPDISWAVIVASFVFFFAAFSPSRWRRPSREVRTEKE